MRIHSHAGFADISDYYYRLRQKPNMFLNTVGKHSRFTALL